MSVVAFLIAVSSNHLQAQCPTSTGLVGTPMIGSTGCYMKVVDAMPNSLVSLYNASGLVTQGTANSSGTVIIPYSCASNPITSISSQSGGQTCNEYSFTQSTTLPVKLSSFTAALNERKQVILKWQTVFEISNNRFEVQKSSDGSTYTTIANINSSGDSYDIRSYSYSDQTFLPGDMAFYRLRQVDQNDQVTYSKNIYVNDKIAESNDVSLFPNPQIAGDNTIQLKGIKASDISYTSLRISDLSGKNISYRITGPNSIEPITNLQTGIYIVKIRDKNLRLVKQP